MVDVVVVIPNVRIRVRTSRGSTPYPFITCSETLYFLSKVFSRKRMIKYKTQGIYIIDRQRKGGVLGKEENRRKNRCFNKHSTPSVIFI